MCKRNNDALFFTCSLIEQLGRSLHMRRGKVAAELGEAGIQTLYRNADILHCEPIEKVADDVITEFSLQGGDFDNLAEARYTVPDVWTMGKVYARLIEDVSDEDNIVETILQVFTSWIDGLLSDYNAAFYYQPRDYIAECYRQKTVLDGRLERKRRWFSIATLIIVEAGTSLKMFPPQPVEKPGCAIRRQPGFQHIFWKIESKIGNIPNFV